MLMGGGRLEAEVMRGLTKTFFFNMNMNMNRESDLTVMLVIFQTKIANKLYQSWWHVY